ncbi:MAG TPA: redoxin domain-containing protein [Pyrinomonadaceae bacterium]|nr:redoxin domain-containing protein [Pyrinomonadaceae bacterium]
MRASVRSNIELAAQVVIAIAVVIAAGVLVKRNVWPGPASGRIASVSTGERLSIPNVDWAQNKKSLVFFLKKDCPYCTSSAGLYRQLVEAATKRNVKCIAVFPNTPEEARKYLQYIELPIENVYTGPLGASKISGTPTVVFVDGGGIVRSVWIGAQTDREQEMRDKLLALFDS